MVFLTCANPAAGATQEFVMKTNPVFLNGTPPASGWVFAIDDCCRNTLVNVGGGGQGFTIRAVMYPFNGQNMNPCYDSSPFFKKDLIHISVSDINILTIQLP